MRREILFRGKCVPDSKYAGEWVTGGYVVPDADCKKQNEGLIIEYFGGNTTITYHVDPDTVGEFTGMRDKHGVKIFEGDIIRFVDGIKRVNEEWVDNEFIYTIEYSEGAFCGVLGLSKVFDAVEVIGNIYDDAELLNKK